MGLRSSIYELDVPQYLAIWMEGLQIWMFHLTFESLIFSCELCQSWCFILAREISIFGARDGNLDVSIICATSNFLHELCKSEFFKAKLLWIRNVLDVIRNWWNCMHGLKNRLFSRGGVEGKMPSPTSLFVFLLIQGKLSL